MFQILGSRKPVLFVDGAESCITGPSNRSLYPVRMVVPHSSCEAVQDATAALRSLPDLHHTNAYGVIDRDRRSDEQHAALEKIGVLAPLVAEVEYLLLVPAAVEVVAQRLGQILPRTSPSSRPSCSTRWRKNWRSR